MQEQHGQQGPSQGAADAAEERRQEREHRVEPGTVREEASPEVREAEREE
jgi:hypothetical protein